MFFGAKINPNFKRVVENWTLEIRNTLILAQKDWQKALATSIMEGANLVPQNDLAKIHGVHKGNL